MIRAARHIGRLIGIVRTLARYDALFVLAWWPAASDAARLLRTLPGFRPMGDMAGLREGQRLTAALEHLGPGFIKFGQALSTRSDILGAQTAADLSQLQDRLPPFPAAQARAAIEAELDAPVDEIFASFEDEAVAAASIAQVHFAVLREADGDFGADGGGDFGADGAPASREVAIKVLRPGVEKAFARDVDLFLWLAEIVERLVPKLRRLKPIATVETFAATVAMEMDLRMEASAAEELADNFADSKIYRVPKINWRLTSRRVMTAERIDGTPIHDVETLVRDGHDLEAIVARSAEVFFGQVFEHGFFHADMHPGNLFVDDDGGLVAVDFGIMGRVDKKTRNYLADMLVGFLAGDYGRVADIHFRAGYIPAGQDRDAFMQALRAIGDPILERPSHEISIARLLAQLFHVTEQFRMETQPQLLLLQKTMLLAEGVGRKLAPEVNMWFLARPLTEDWVLAHRGPQARLRDLVEEAVETVGLIPAAIRRLAAEPEVPEPAPRRVVWPLWTAIIVLALWLLLA